MQPTDRLTVTLEAQAWENVMRILSEIPYKVAAPLIQEIQNQCMTQTAQQTRAMMPADANGQARMFRPHLAPEDHGPVGQPAAE